MIYKETALEFIHFDIKRIFLYRVKGIQLLECCQFAVDEII